MLSDTLKAKIETLARKVLDNGSADHSDEYILIEAAAGNERTIEIAYSLKPENFPSEAEFMAEIDRQAAALPPLALEVSDYLHETLTKLCQAADASKEG